MARMTRIDMKRPWDRPWDRHRVIALVGAAGAATVMAGAALPWLTVFHGLRSYPGIAGLNGRLLAAGGAAAALLAVWYSIQPRSQVRYTMGVLGGALAVFCAYLVAQLLALYRALQGVYLPAIGPGLMVAAAGTLLLIATLFVSLDAIPADATPAVSVSTGERLPAFDARAAALIALAAGAGTIHLTASAPHVVEFGLYGAFFVGLGVAQIGWAAIVALRGVSLPLLLLAGLGNLPVICLWIASRTTGLPIGPAPWVPEPIGFADVAATAFEVVLVACTAWSLTRRRHVPRQVACVGWVAPLVIATVTIAAVLIAVGAGAHPPAAG